MAAQDEDEKFCTNLLNCSICYQVYTAPKVLPCLHIFCLDCLSRHYVLSKENKREKLLCPKCEEVIPLPAYAKGVDSLKDDTISQRIKDIFKHISMEVEYKSSIGSSEDQSSNGPHKKSVKVRDKSFIKHIKRKEEIKQELGEVKEVMEPLCEELLDLYHGFYNAKCNWKRELRQMQSVLVTDPEMPDVNENREIMSRNRRKVDIADRYEPVVEWITSRQDNVHEKLKELKSISDVAKEMARRATYNQLKDCKDPLDALIRNALEMVKDTSGLASKPDDYEKLTEKIVFNPLQDKTNKEDATEALAELNKEIAAPVIGQYSDHPDPRKVTVKLVAKISGKGSGPGQFNSPQSAAFAPNGDIMVADKNNFRVQIFEPNGSYKGELFKGRIKPTRVCINPMSFTFYVDDEGSKTLKVYTAEGLQETGRIGGAHWSKDLIFHTFDQKGNIIMSHPSKCSITIHQRDDGEIIHDFFFNYFEEIAPVHNPHFVAMTKEDHVIISEATSNHVQVFSYSGRYLYRIGNVLVPRGVCADLYGNVFVAEGDTHRISLFNRYGKLAQYLLTEKDGIKYPMSLVINDNGCLVVTQFGLHMPHEVLIFQLNYRKETVL